MDRNANNAWAATASKAQARGQQHDAAGAPASGAPSAARSGQPMPRQFAMPARTAALSTSTVCCGVGGSFVPAACDADPRIHDPVILTNVSWPCT
eukprot:363824-Chlamydomonas_euryale.AAC.12